MFVDRSGAGGGEEGRGEGAAGLAAGLGSDAGRLGHSAGVQASPELGASEARTVASSKRLSVSLSGCRSCLPESDLLKHRRTLGKKSLFFPQGFLEPPCLLGVSEKWGVGWELPSGFWDLSQLWEWDLLTGDPRGPGSAFSLSWYTPILALRPGKSGRVSRSRTYFLLWGCCKDFLRMIKSWPLELKDTFKLV